MRCLPFLLLLAACDPRGGDARRTPPSTPVEDADVVEDAAAPPPVDLGPPAPDAAPFDVPERITLAGYNVHNLFDLVDDPRTDEGEFTPGSQWNATDLALRVRDLARVFVALDADVVAVVEIESEAALTTLRDAITTAGGPVYPWLAVSTTGDGRGIRLGVLSRLPLGQVGARPVNRVHMCQGDEGPVTLDGSQPEARPIFQVELALGDTPAKRPILLINHWKARLESYPCVADEHRLRAALQLRDVVDQLIAQAPDRPVVAMGDFNTFEFEAPIRNALGAVLDPALLERPGDLYNSWGDAGVQLFNANDNRRNNATNSSYAFRGDWTRLDHILLTANLEPDSGTAGWRRVPGSGGNIHNDFLFDGRGYPLVWEMRGASGYSDHLPVHVVLEQRPDR